MSISSSVATSAVDLKMTDHALQRMRERNLPWRTLQSTRKHGSRIRSRGERQRIVTPEVVLVTDARGQRVITAMATAPTGQFPAYQRDVARGDMASVQRRHDDIMAEYTDIAVQEAVRVARSRGVEAVDLSNRRLNVGALAVELAFDLNVEAVRFVLTHYPVARRACDPKGRLITHILTRQGKSEVALELAAQFPDELGLNATSQDGNTLLTYAAAMLAVPRFYELVGEGCDPFLRNRAGHSPLSKLLKNTRYVTVRLCFEGTRTRPEERWVPCAAVPVSVTSVPRSCAPGSAIGGRQCLAPVCPTCTVHGYQRHFVTSGRGHGHGYGGAEAPLVQVRDVAPELGQALLRVVLEYAGVGSVGVSDHDSKSLPSLRGRSWRCAWCQQQLTQRVFGYSRWADTDSDSDSDSDLADPDADWTSRTGSGEPMDCGED
jgi:hypothetical protein